MDFLLLLLPLCLGVEFFYLMRMKWKPALSTKGKLVLSFCGYMAVVAFCLLVAHFDRDNFRGDGIYLPRMGLVLKGWAVSATLLVGTFENLVLSIVAIAKHVSTTSGNRVLPVLLVFGMALPVPLVLWGPRWYRHQVAQREYQRRLDYVLAAGGKTKVSQLQAIAEQVSRFSPSGADKLAYVGPPLNERLWIVSESELQRILGHTAVHDDCDMLSGHFASGIGLVRNGKATSDGIRDAEALLRLDYVLVVRQREVSLPESHPPGHRIEGHYAGDALLFRLADGAFLDGFRVEATRNEPKTRYSPRNDLCLHARQDVLDKARALAVVMW